MMLVTPAGTVHAWREPVGPVLVALKVTVVGADAVKQAGVHEPEMQLVEAYLKAKWGTP